MSTLISHPSPFPSSPFCLFLSPHLLLLYFQHLRREKRPLAQTLDPIASWHSSTPVCVCVSVWFMCLIQTQWELGVPTPHPPPTSSTKLSKNVCERFRGGSPERQIELRSQLESLKLCYSSSADSRSTHPGQRVFPLTETCMFFFLIPAHFSV